MADLAKLINDFRMREACRKAIRLLVQLLISRG